MKWFIALLLLSGSSFFLYTWYHDQVIAPPQPVTTPPMAQATEPKPFLSVADLERIKKSAADPDSGVRWSALELLFSFHDPDSVTLLEKAIAEDPDPELRLKAIRLLKDAKDIDKIPGLIRALHDTDREVRLASLKALGDVADPAATPWVVEALKDPDPELKVAALQTLGKFEEKRKRDFQVLAEKLRQQYEDAVNGAKKQRPEGRDEWNLE